MLLLLGVVGDGAVVVFACGTQVFKQSFQNQFCDFGFNSLLSTKEYGVNKWNKNCIEGSSNCSSYIFLLGSQTLPHDRTSACHLESHSLCSFGTIMFY